MHDLRVPRLNTNDDSYVLTAWLVLAGSWVSPGDLVAEVETSKSTAEMTAEAAGYIQQLAAIGEPVVPGAVFARLHEEAGGAVNGEASAEDPEPVEARVNVTRSAQALMDEHGLSLRHVRRLGKPLIKAEDVRHLLAMGSDPRRTTTPEGVLGQPLLTPPIQVAVARSVSKSAATIPAAFTAMKVPADAIARQQEELATTGRGEVGHPEFVVCAVARSIDAHPVFAAVVVDGTAHLPPGRADIGVTVDVGTGLFVVSLQCHPGTAPVDIASQLLRLRMRALRGRLSDTDIGSPRLTVTLHTAPGVTVAQPLIAPGQTCALSVCALEDEIVLLDSGSVGRRSVFSLGLAYDHRFINGADAVAFLNDVRRSLQSPLWRDDDTRPGTLQQE